MKYESKEQTPSIRYIVFEVSSCRSCFFLTYTEDGPTCMNENITPTPQILKDEDEIPKFCPLPKELK